jgi:hypothetical protein
MAEWTSVAVQTVNPGEAIVFTDTAQSCPMGYILHRDDSGAFLMKGIDTGSCIRRCCCKPATVNYMVDFGANIAIPEGETVGPISVAFALDGNTLAGTEMEVTPAAVEQYFNVSRAANVSIWKGCCQTLSIRNTGTTPILVQAANIVFAKK